MRNFRRIQYAQDGTRLRGRDVRRAARAVGYTNSQYWNAMANARDWGMNRQDALRTLSDSWHLNGSDQAPIERESFGLAPMDNSVLVNAGISEQNRALAMPESGLMGTRPVGERPVIQTSTPRTSAQTTSTESNERFGESTGRELAHRVGSALTGPIGSAYNAIADGVQLAKEHPEAAKAAAWSLAGPVGAARNAYVTGRDAYNYITEHGDQIRDAAGRAVSAVSNVNDRLKNYTPVGIVRGIARGVRNRRSQGSEGQPTGGSAYAGGWRNAADYAD